jgi:hypothetical protein
MPFQYEHIHHTPSLNIHHFNRQEPTRSLTLSAIKKKSYTPAFPPMTAITASAASVVAVAAAAAAPQKASASPPDSYSAPPPPQP